MLLTLQRVSWPELRDAYGLIARSVELKAVILEDLTKALKQIVCQEDRLNVDDLAVCRDHFDRLPIERSHRKSCGWSRSVSLPGIRSSKSGRTIGANHEVVVTRT